ncbi:MULTISPECIES: DUF1289 domain-containing protein [unclassified Rhizobium]|uniref:DUF1289 domain-containing protein n=1 Tax=unclassified Rhizobium TaxID=2613769 RepID=UPI001A98E261|nr:MULTISPECIES: DUF1289 domain-containing protein [unclassified Rhizobium]MBX5167079.1 DUF1289 domain-containing protein [Rhizobium sp. NZLR4b]MBX5173038.1 DUF1289 domain-containing protein [Rhizobium sp. NZLR1b]MBX5185393.1 DUF1289 domain-containing protein [Rhizobium sp. NZLR5]MBX5190698.1 DUF1289 domain-containing protein [Rhizobium sp. NZLR3b]MBX5198195.1 DUF1289 domain-containing protein [Rhizobium sp. NZLR10]
MQTPCIHLCSLEPATGFCAGCGRTLQEIGSWVSYSDTERRGIMALLPARLAGAAAVSNHRKTGLSSRPERPL